MKSKIILALGLASSVFFGRYLLTPSEKANLQNSTTISKVETAKPTPFIQPEKPRWLDSNATNVDQNAQLEIEQKETDLNNIENCPECLQKLKNKLLHGNLKELEKLAAQLAETNEPELALVLADVSGKKMSVQRRDILLSALQKFNSPQVAKAFANYLTQPNQMPDFLRYQLATNINQMADRQQITNDLVNVFNQTQEVEKRNQLLAIDYPEMLAQVSDQALKNNDLKLFNQATEQLQSNPYDFAPDAILSLENSLSQGELQQMLNTLMERQGSGSRLDFIESQFVQGNYSPEEQTMMLEALTHSENLEQGANIIAKFSNSTRH